jgi:hypothetical protein
MFRNWLVGVQFAVAIPGALSIFVEDGLQLYWLAFAGVALLGLWIYLSLKHVHYREPGEKARRATLIVNGLGHKLSDALILQLNDMFDVSQEEVAKHKDSEYFASTEEAGYARLAQMLEQSAYFSGYLHKKSCFTMAALFAAGILASLLILLAAIPVSTSSELMIGARVVLATLVFFLSSDVAGAAFSHWNAWTEAERIRSILDAASARNYPPGDVLLCMSDYNAAMEAAPVVVPFIYRAYATRLNRHWNTYQAAKYPSRADAR